MLGQTRESVLRQTLHVSAASDTQNIQSSDFFWTKRHFKRYDKQVVNISINVSTTCWNDSDARQKRGNLRYAIAYNIIWANQKIKSSEHHCLRTLAMFDETSFHAILSGIWCQFKFCRYVNFHDASSKRQNKVVKMRLTLKQNQSFGF